VELARMLVQPEPAPLQARAVGRIPSEEPAGRECRLWQAGGDYLQ